MDFLRSWIEQITIAVIIASIFEMILPNSKMKKYIKMILGVFIVFNMISPFVNKNDLYNFKIDNIMDKDSLQSIDTSSNTGNDKIEEIYIKEMEKDISNTIKDQGFNVKSCKINAVIYSDKEEAGINSIDIVLGSKNKTNISNKSENISNINEVEKIEVDIGNQEKDEDTSISEKDINKLKKFLSNHYEIKKDVINIR